MHDKKQLDLIISLFSNGKVQEALDQLDPLIKVNPNDAVVFNIRQYYIGYFRPPLCV